VAAAVVVGLAAAFPALASAGTIAGTVSEAAGSNAPLAGVKVCSHVDPHTFEDSCTTTDAGGNYSLSSLPAGSYSVHFDDSAVNRNVVSQYYGGSDSYPGTRVTLASPSETLSGIDAQLPPGGTITGAVTDAPSHLPLAGIPVCAFAESIGYERCERSEASGAYVINGLPAGSYDVEFQSGLLNYQSQSYDGSVWPEPWTPVTIFSPGEVESGIDAAMRPGVEISGQLTEAGSDRPLAGIPVELLRPGRESTGWIVTGSDGRYAYRGLAEGEYVLAFATAHGPFGSNDTCFATQYFHGSAALSGATVLHGVPGTAITGIDGQLVSTCPATSGPPPLQVSFVPAASSPKRQLLRCRNGFQRRQVKGKVRCVKRHKDWRHHKHSAR
jgi:hypothetical protein